MKGPICEESPEVFRKEWALRDLRGAAASCVRRTKSCFVKQVLGMERRSRSYGLSREQTHAAIHEGMAGVPNPNPGKVRALRKQLAE